MRSKVQWLPLDEDDAMWTPGWIPDSPHLRYSLADAIRVEGVRDDRSASYEAAEGATIVEAWVVENDDGEWVVVPDPVVLCSAATVAYLEQPE